MKEKLQEYALIAEIISAVCIILSLIFVGMQVRIGANETAENSEAIRGQVRESMLNSDMDILRYAAEYPYVLNFASYDGEITKENLARFRVYLYMLFRSREHYWQQHKRGLLDKETYDSYIVSLILELESDEYAMGLWDRNARRGEINPEFADEVSDLLEMDGQ